MTQPKEIFLKDYSPSPYEITTVDLTIEIFDDHTAVTNISRFIKKDTSTTDLTLYGEDLILQSVKIDDKIHEHSTDTKTLTVQNLPDEFTLETVVHIDPANNFQLMGLYKSDDILCTQCEPEGFRRITYHLDRPDVMSMYTCTLIADKTKYPILLSNGNPVQREDREEGRHMVKWEDPFKKPSYLFAVVAGDLVCTESTFTTMSGKVVPLKIYTDSGNQNRVDHAMESLKKAMKWDEEEFGREYDLDIFMIVAADAFNAGAMENKGLNIFNSAAILCDKNIATDNEYKFIEAVIAHEYFHNWTGDRITCRDWFQLTLKEGLTVYRDSEFSSDMQDRAVKRIEDASYIREGQFAEDAGPMAHPIQPQSFIEIENFYTRTVYEKGSEVIRMLRTMYGKENFRKAMDLYFETFDGQAVTVDEFLWSFEKALSVDLSQFKQSWYLQAGTPHVSCEGEYDAENKRYHLTVEQSCPYPKKDHFTPYHFPLSVGLLSKYGAEIAAKTLIITNRKETFTFENVSSHPIPSLLRNFSAPVKLDYTYSLADDIFLFANDTDEVNRYEAGQRVARRIIMDLMTETRFSVPEEVIKAYKHILDDRSVSDALRAEYLSLPGLFSIVESQETYDYIAAHQAKQMFTTALSNALTEEFLHTYHADQENTYSKSAASMGKRRLKNICLNYLSENDTDYTNLIMTQFETADNMTDSIAALMMLCKGETTEKKNALFDFHARWKKEPLAMNKWFAVQASSQNKHLLEHMQTLEKHESYDHQNPNKIRSLLGSFCRNTVHFHAENGSGYQYIADKILEIDTFNEKIASSLANAFGQYAKMPDLQKEHMKTQIQRILETKDISAGLYEVMSKTLESGEE